MYVCMSQIPFNTILLKTATRNRLISFTALVRCYFQQMVFLNQHSVLCLFSYYAFSHRFSTKLGLLIVLRKLTSLETFCSDQNSSRWKLYIISLILLKLVVMDLLTCIFFLSEHILI